MASESKPIALIRTLIVAGLVLFQGYLIFDEMSDGELSVTLSIYSRKTFARIKRAVEINAEVAESVPYLLFEAETVLDSQPPTV